MEVEGVAGRSGGSREGGGGCGWMRGCAGKGERAGMEPGGMERMGEDGEGCSGMRSAGIWGGELEGQTRWFWGRWRGRVVWDLFYFVRTAEPPVRDFFYYFYFYFPPPPPFSSPIPCISLRQRKLQDGSGVIYLFPRLFISLFIYFLINFLICLLPDLSVPPPTYLFFFFLVYLFRRSFISLFMESFIYPLIYSHFNQPLE